VTPWRRLLVDHDFARGCPLAATICDAADNDNLRTHVSELLAGWRAPVAEAYTRFGAPQAEAEAHATVLVAALEGALILAGAQRTIEPLDTVERFFASRAPGPSAARTHARRSRLPIQRSDLKAARISVAKSSGSSQAAKWPPLSTSWK
jgi:hypothetical protein